MPKRKSETREERWARKLKKYKAKVNENKRSRRIVYSSDEEENGVQLEEHLEPMTSEYIEMDMLSENPVELVESTEPEEQVINDDPTTGENNDFDVGLIQSLGNVEIEPDEFAEEIHPDLATRYQNILLNGLSKETKEDLFKKYISPKNMPLSRAPTLNPEIEAMLVDNCRLRDKRLICKQDQLGRALSALGKGLTGLLKKNRNITEVIQTLNDVGKLLADSHYAETETRRTIILPLMEKSLSNTFKNRKRDRFLFGDNLGEAVRNSRGITKTSELIQAPTTTRPLNFKGPPLRTRQSWGRPYPQPRAGGQRYQYSQRTRLTGPYNNTQYPLPPPPQSAARHQPPPARRPPPPKQRANIPDRLR